MELTRLQRNFESCMEEIHQMERALGQTAAVWALGTALAGTAFMAGSVFAVTGEPPRYLAMILLAVRFCGVAAGPAGLPPGIPAAATQAAALY